MAIILVDGVYNKVWSCPVLSIPDVLKVLHKVPSYETGGSGY